MTGQISLRWGGGDRADLHAWNECYEVAGHEIISPQPVTGLEPFRVAARPGLAPSPPSQCAKGPETCRLWYRGEVPMAGHKREVRSWAGAEGYRIEVEGLSPFEVVRDGGVITCGGEGEVGRSDLFTEALLGPALTVALALRDTFCLHASALRRGERVVALTGESGAGKSTLAREVDLATDGRWARIADDALPVVKRGRNIEAEAHFPQLKLDASEQSTPGRRGRFPLAAIVVLEPADPADGVQLERTGPAGSLIAVASQTIAARLFDRELLSRHLAFCLEVARLTQVFRLTYPHRPSAVAEVVGTLDRLVGQDLQVGAGA